MDEQRPNWRTGGLEADAETSSTCQASEPECPRRAAYGYRHTTDVEENKMANRSTVSSIDEYIATFSPETQKVLEELAAVFPD